MTIENVPDQPLLPSERGSSVFGEQSFEELAASMPEDARGFLDDALPNAPVVESAGGGVTGEDAAAKRTKRIKLSKKMQKTMDRFKSKVSEFPIMWFHSQAAFHPEWELDEQEKEWVKDSIDTVFEVLDIEAQIEPITATITSVWWVIAYPILVLIGLFAIKKAKVPAEPEPEQPEQSQP